MVFVTSCTNQWANLVPKSSFDSPFPKANKDLSQILGSKLYIKRGKDTAILNIRNTGKYNLITDKNGDTIFCGTVSHFRGLYYFSQSITDTSYLIYAVKIVGDKMYGLNAPWYEGVIIDHHIKKGEYKDMVKSISRDSLVIRLHPVKSEMRKLYALIMDSIPPDTLLAVPAKMAQPVKIDIAAITAQFDPEEYALLSKVYPNPASDELNIELQQKGEVKYMISDILGKGITNGELHDTLNKVDVSTLHSGVYILTLTKADGKGEESVKIIKE